jgi:hypothetical protein
MYFNKINFGKADAHTEGEDYPKLLEDGYLDIESVVDQALNSSTFLFLGHKGSGKSSLSEHLRLKLGDSIVDQQGLRDFPFREFDKALQIEDRVLRYKKLWQWMLCVKIFCDLYKDSDAIIQAADSVKTVIDIFTQSGIFPVISISSLVSKVVSNTAKATSRFFEISHAETTNNMGVDIEMALDYLKQVLLSFKEEKQHVLIIDDLDDVLSPNGIQFYVIAALINEVKELNRFFSLSNVPVKILVLCRTDMFERLPDPNKNKIKQDNSFVFTWYREGVDNPRKSDLINLVNIRARLVYPELADVFKTFFPSNYGGTNIYTALLDYTRHTPRDFIQLLNHIQRQCKRDTVSVSSNQIEKGINEYSAEYFKQEIADEMSGYLTRQTIEGVYNVLSSIRSRDFYFDKFVEKSKYNMLLKDADPYEIMKVLYDCSAIGHVYSYDGGSNSRVSFKYRNRASSFTSQDKILLHKGLWKALNVNY